MVSDTVQLPLAFAPNFLCYALLFSVLHCFTWQHEFPFLRFIWRKFSPSSVLQTALPRNTWPPSNFNSSLTRE